VDVIGIQTGFAIHSLEKIEGGIIKVLVFSEI